MDKLKEYLQGRKADLDVDSPASDAWEQIASKIPGPSSRSGSSSWVVRYSVAASLIVLVSAGIWLVLRNNKLSTDTVQNNGGVAKAQPATGKEKVEVPERTELPAPKEEKTPDKEIVRNGPVTKRAHRNVRPAKPVELSDEVDVIDKSYSSLIDFELRKLRATPLYAENGSYFSFYVEQFKQMDKDEQAVRNTIKAYGLTNEYLEQLINVYQEKLNVLKNLQTEINKVNNKVREKQGRSESPEIHYLDI